MFYFHFSPAGYIDDWVFGEPPSDWSDKYVVYESPCLPYSAPLVGKSPLMHYTKKGLVTSGIYSDGNGYSVIAFKGAKAEFINETNSFSEAIEDAEYYAKFSEKLPRGWRH